MITISNANPIQFWPVNTYTFNSAINGFVDQVNYYHQQETDDIIKLQLTETDATRQYVLLVTDVNSNILNVVSFVPSGTYRQISFTAATLSFPVADTCVYLYIVYNDGSFTFDGTFDFTFAGILANVIYQSDPISFLSVVTVNASYGSKIIQYQSTKNFAGIQYPNDSSPFYLRVPCRFFQERPKLKQNSIELSNSQIVNTSVSMSTQKLMVTTYLPDYMHKKIILSLQHAVRGSVFIDGQPFILDDSYEVSSPDPKSPMQMGKVWLTREDSMVRNVI